MRLFILTLAIVVISSWSGHAQDSGNGDRASIAEARARAIVFLKNSQDDDGSWTSSNSTGISALVTTALLKSGLSSDDPAVKAGLNHLLSHARQDGGIYHEQSLHRNYETCISIMALQAASTDGRYDRQLKAAEQFLRALQWDQGEGLETSDTAFGGAGYGKHQRPDLSNTQFLIEALKTAGVAEDDPAIQNALTFVSRTQNLESAHNQTPFATKVNDGGFYYTPAAGGSSQAGETANGGLRSYGSMTYAGLKSMIYAGLEKDDERVKAATEWIGKFYTLEENPGMGQQGLFYYYHTFAKALDAVESDTLTDANQQKHNWRNELAATLTKLQRPNGSWVNDADRWYEGDPNLSTAYSLLALSYCGE